MLNTLQLKLLVALGFILILSCNKVEDALNAEVNNYSPDLAFTLIDSRVEARSILQTLNAEAQINTDADGLLSLNYSGKVFEVNPDSLFQLPTLAYSMTDSIIDLSLVSVFLSQLDLKEGFLTYNIFWDDFRDLTINVLLTNSFHRITGEPLTFEVIMESNTAPIYAQGQIDLTDYVITPAAGGFALTYEAITNFGNERVIVDEFNFALADMEFNYLEGLLSTVGYAVPPDTVVFDVLQNLSSGYIWYEDPSLDITVRNSFGYEVIANMNVFEIGSKSAQNVPIETDLIVDNAITMDYPSLSEIGVIKEKVLHLDKNNSNIQEILYPLMEEIRYDVSGLLNPNVQVGHMTDSSILSIDIDLDMPWAGWGHDVVSLSYFDVDMSQFNGELDYANFKLATENLIPATVDLQIYFVESNGDIIDNAYTGTIIDSLMTEETLIMAAASVNADGRATEAVENHLLVKIPEDRFKKIVRNSTRILMKTEVNTLEQPNQRVKMYDSYYFDIRLGVEVGIDDL